MLRTPSTSDDHKNIIDGIALSKARLSYSRVNPLIERTVFENSFDEEGEYLIESARKDNSIYFKELLKQNRLPINIIRLAMKYDLSALNFQSDIGYDDLLKRAKKIGYNSKSCPDFRR